MRGRGARLLALAVPALTALAAGIAVPAGAGSLRIMPIRVEVNADARFCSLTVTNDEDTPVSVQVRGYGWSKDANNADVLTEDPGFQINPTIVTLAGKQERLVRCGLPPVTGTGEQTWRLVLDELPQPGPAVGGVRTLLRISVPVFRAAAEAQPDLVWSIGTDAQGKPALVIENRGTRHAQVLSLDLEGAGSGQAPTRVTRSFYVLAGGRAEVALPGTLAGTPDSVRATTPDGPLDLRPRAGP